MSSHLDLVRFRLLQKLEIKAHASQRELARELGVSLGSVNFCIKEFVNNKVLKVETTEHSHYKRTHAYHITKKGRSEKVTIIKKALALRLEDYDAVKKDIADLKSELDKS